MKKGKTYLDATLSHTTDGVIQVDLGHGEVDQFLYSEINEAVLARYPAPIGFRVKQLVSWFCGKSSS